MIQPCTVSRCPNCKGLITITCTETFEKDEKMRKDFYKEVAKHNLTVETIPKSEMIKMRFCFENDCERKSKS